MFNDLSTPLAYLSTRRTAKARDMIAPGPSPTELRAMITIAARTPDHGKLAPWRFVIIDEAKRGAFATMLHKAYLAERPEAARLELDAMTQFAQQAPTLVAVLATPRLDSKIPVWEQELSAGAVCMNLLHAAHASGFAGCWLSGWPAYNHDVLESLGGCGADRIAGFVFIGTPGREIEERPRPEYDAIVSDWEI